MSRQIKGGRKIRSLHNREATLKYLIGIFQKKFKDSTGSSQERFNAACVATDKVTLELFRSAPEKKSFYALVVEDFKLFIERLLKNQAAVESAAPVEVLV